MPWRARRAAERAAHDYGVDWWMWRVLASSELRQSLVEMRDHWTFVNLFHAQVVLDSIEDGRPDPRDS